MPIIYLCTTGTYASIVAANIHLNKLSKESSIDDINNLPYFLDTEGKKGEFYFIGKDEENRPIYTLGTLNEVELLKKSAYDLISLTQKDAESVKFIDLSEFAPKYIRLKNIPIFKTSLVHHIKDVLPQLTEIVELNKRKIRQEH